MTDDGEEFGTDQEEPEHSDAEEFQCHEDMAASLSFLQEDHEAHLCDSIQLAPHACLHLLSPKLDTLALAAAQQGASTEDTVSTALEWAWLVPMLGASIVKLKAFNHCTDVLLAHSDTSLPAKQEVSITATTAQAPAMSYMPSIESMASSTTMESSDNDYIPSVATSSYQSDMARSQSLLSSFSVASCSTAASSVASTSKSILDRKRPLPSRTASSTGNATQVIKLRTRRYQQPVQGNVRSQSGLTRRDTTMSVVSQAASIHSSSPSADELDCMTFEPMVQLPSPTMSASHFEAVPCLCNSETEVSSSDSVNEEYGARAALFEIWVEAEVAERQRKLKKKQPTKSTGPSISDAGADRVQKWVSKVRKSASAANLRPRTSKNTSLNTIADPVAWAEGQMCKGDAFQPEEVLEPRQALKDIEGIEKVLRSGLAKPALSARASTEATSGHIWDFLG